MAALAEIDRRRTHAVQVGDVTIGGGAPALYLNGHNAAHLLDHARHHQNGA